jgi:2-haloacid dehalogenase
MTAKIGQVEVRRRHAPTGIRPHAILFDLLTGLIDSWTLWESVAGAVDGRRWREAYLRNTYAEAAYRPYEDLVLEAAIDAGLPVTFPDRLLARYDELEPWPEVNEVLGRLVEHIPFAVVTNCCEVLGRIAAARIDIAFKVIITAERAGFYKPHPRPYQLALEALGMRPDECLFVAGSAYDLAGAASVALPVFWHNRIGMTAPPDLPPLIGCYDTLFPLLPMVLGQPAA